MFVSFEENGAQFKRNPLPESESGLNKLIMSTGLAKNKAQANMIMVGLLVVMLVMIFFVVSSRGTSVPPTPDGPIDINTGLPI